MKPGRRRLLIPGLLIALLIVVMLASAIRQADAETTPLPVVPHKQVSTLTDPRIVESSGLVASQEHPGLAYTINDSGDAPRVFAVDIASGDVVGVTTVEGVRWHDAEAMSYFGGQLWVGDIGSLRGRDEGRALYVFDEPGPGNHRVTAKRYALEFQGGDVETEAMVVVPGWVFFFSKGWPRGYTFQLYGGDLSESGLNTARLSRREAPAWTTDATSTADGRYVLVRGNVNVEVRDVLTWKLLHVDVIPILKQGETIAMEATGQSYLIGSEGADSPLIRIAFNPATFTTPPPEIDPGAQTRAQDPLGRHLRQNQDALVRAGAAAAVVGGLGLLWWARRRRRRSAASVGDGKSDS